MKEFAFASRADFLDLDNILSDGRLHVYKNRQLPASCKPKIARVGFEKHDDGEYVFLIDKGIVTSSQHCGFSSFLKMGEVRFCTLNGMIDFFHSLQPLYSTATAERSSDAPITGRVSLPILAPGDSRVPHMIADTQADGRPARNAEDVVDKNRLKSITEADNIPKQVWPEEIAEPLKSKIFGQDTAIDALADAIVINQMKKNDKLLVMALLGPPATGKSETGRSLAEVMSSLYGREYGFIEIAASEYVEEHMVHCFLGAPPSYAGHGGKTVLDPVRTNPYHVLLINEIEKAHEKMLVALMEAMDTGLLGMADNSPAIDLNHCILLFTSNLPIDLDRYREASDFERSELCKDAFTKHCGKPEISRRIQEFLVFVPLSADARVDVIIKFAKMAMEDYDAELVHIDEHLMADFLRYKTKYGASELGNYVSKAIGRKMIQDRCPDLIRGKRIRIKGTVDNIRFETV